MAMLDVGPRNYFKLHTDGSITAEQGQAEGEGAIGVVLRDPNGFVVHQISTRIGWVKDHHVAEYRALIAGLRLARGHGVDDLHAFSDSKLVVNQLHGNSQTRSAHLRELRDEARALLDEFRQHQLSWISRKRNEEADLLAGRALGR